MRVVPSKQVRVADTSNVKIVRVGSRKGLGRHIVSNVAGSSSFQNTTGGGSISGLASIMSKFRRHREGRRKKLGFRVQVAGICLFITSANIAFSLWVLLGLGVVSIDEVWLVAAIAGIGAQCGFVLFSMADTDIDSVFNESTPKITGSVWVILAAFQIFLAALKGLPLLLAVLPCVYALWYLHVPKKGLFTNCCITIMALQFIGWGVASVTRALGWGSLHLDMGLR